MRAASVSYVVFLLFLCCFVGVECASLVSAWTGAVSSFERFGETISAARHHLIAGAAARGFSIFVMYPLDTVKTRLQLAPGREKIASVVGQLGVPGLYKGLAGSLVGQVPYGTLTFGSYEVYKEMLLQRFGDAQLGLISLCAAIMGDITGSVWLVPSEQVKQQLQGGVYNSVSTAVRSTWKSGGLPAFYRGWLGQVMRDVPFRAIQMPAYELTKRFYLANIVSRRPRDGGEGAVTLSAGDSVVVGAVAGTISAAITTPLDVLKTRLMTQTTAQGTFATAASIVRQEGLVGMFQGIGPRVAYIGPSCGLFFLVYEGVKSRVKRADP